MNSVTNHWQTSLAGVLAGALYAASQLYKPGMSWHDWLAAAGIAVVGLLASDGNKTP